MGQVQVTHMKTQQGYLMSYAVQTADVAQGPDAQRRTPPGISSPEAGEDTIHMLDRKA